MENKTTTFNDCATLEYVIAELFDLILKDRLEVIKLASLNRY